MTHLTEELLNEYLDQALNQIQRTEIESHLGTCLACAARMNQLRVLFSEIDSLPDIKLERDLSSAILSKVNHPIRFSPLLQLIFVAQSLAALIIVSVVAILNVQTLTMNLDVSMFIASTESFITELQMLLTSTQSTFDQLTQLFIQPLPIEVPTLTLVLFVTALSLLWAAGNGLLLTSISRRRA